MTTIDRARFATGLTYEQYKGQMTRNLDRIEANEGRVVIDPDDLEAFRSANGPIHVLALAEDWCGDVIANLPVRSSTTPSMSWVSSPSGRRA
jgi:hypothetical protein